MKIEERIEISKKFKNFRFIFITDAPGSVTSFMKCELPTKVLNYYDIKAAILDKKYLNQYIDQAQDNDVLILSKVHPWLDSSTIKKLELVKSKVNKIFCEASEEGSFDCFLSKFDLHKENLLLFNSNIVDGFLYETKQLKDLMVSKLDHKNSFLYTRHLHSNCHHALNPYSSINHNFEIKNKFDQISALSTQCFKEYDNITSIGYIGHPKYCHNYLALNIANYELSHKVGITLKFVSSNPGPLHNIPVTNEVDFAFSLIEKNNHSEVYYNYKTSNKVNALWSLGIPGLFSPLPSYTQVFQENDVDFEEWSIPQEYSHFDCHIRNSQSLGREIANKVFKIISDKDFHEKRRILFNVSLRYNPMNIFWLYQEMFESLH